jgi:hypothetical protein
MSANCVQVDINNGKCVPYSAKPKNDKQGEQGQPQPKRAATSGHSLAGASSSSSASSSASSIEVRMGPHRPTIRVASAEALHAHFLSARICYEAPMHADCGMGNADAQSSTIMLMRAWPSLDNAVDETKASTDEKNASQFKPLILASSVHDEDADVTVHPMQAQGNGAQAAVTELVQKRGSHEDAQSRLLSGKCETLAAVDDTALKKGVLPEGHACEGLEGAVAGRDDGTGILNSGVAELESPSNGDREVTAKLEAATGGECNFSASNLTSGGHRGQQLADVVRRLMHCAPTDSARMNSTASSEEGVGLHGLTAAAGCHTVQVLCGRVHAASPHVLDLSNSTASQLMELSRASGAATAFEDCLLHRAPCCTYLALTCC